MLDSIASALALRTRAALLLALGAVAGRAAAGPILLMHPTLVVLDSGTRSAEVNVMNHGDVAGVFVIGWVDYSMTDDGGLLVEGTPGPWSAQPYLRYSPRRVTLAPGQSQVVRIALRPSQGAPEGEYRSHLRVLSLPVPDAPNENPTIQPASSVHVVARPAMSIPVIWRNGAAKPGASITSAVFDPHANRVVASVLRQGALSVRGYLHVLAPGGSPLAAAVPLVIYGNLPGRTMDIPLAAASKDHALEQGTEVVYSTSLDPRLESAVIASTRVTHAP
jgi:P pilus assembly chaperone PapD